MHNQNARPKLWYHWAEPKEKADLLNNSSVFTKEAYDHMTTFPDRNYDEPALDVSFRVTKVGRFFYTDDITIVN